MTPAAIIFDFDGVIVDSESISADVFSSALTAAGLPTSRDEAIERYMGRHRADTLAQIHAFWGAAVPPDIAERLQAETERHFMRPMPAVPGALAFLAQTGHLRRAIASSSSTNYLRSHVRFLGLEDHFDKHIYSGREHVARGKPHPDIYLHAMAALGVTPPETLIIEDSPIGARAAVASGAQVVGLTAGSHARPSLTTRLEAEGVHVLCDSYARLGAMIGLAPVDAAQ